VRHEIADAHQMSVMDARAAATIPNEVATSYVHHMCVLKPLATSKNHHDPLSPSYDHRKGLELLGRRKAGRGRAPITLRLAIQCRVQRRLVARGPASHFVILPVRRFRLNGVGRTGRRPRGDLDSGAASRLDQEKRMHLREVDQLKRDQAELEELKESLERLKEPEPEPEAAPESRPPRGRRPVLPGDMEILAALRLKRPSLSCRTDFYATLPKDIKKHRMAQRYRDADKGLRAANSPTAGK
jgi:hypothetical protein